MNNIKFLEREIATIERLRRTALQKFERSKKSTEEARAKFKEIDTRYMKLIEAKKNLLEQERKTLEALGINITEIKEVPHAEAC